MSTVADCVTEMGIRNDGRVCNDPAASGDMAPSLYLPGQPESENYRLSTYRGFPVDSTALPRRLAEAGFYYTGQRDIVKCFSCGQCIENFDRREDPSDRRYHHEDCDLLMGRNHGNIPAPTPTFRGLLQLHNRVANERQEEVARRSPEPPAPQPRQEEPNRNVQPNRDRQIPRAEESVARSGRDIPPPAAEQNTAFPCHDPQLPHMRNATDRIMSFARAGSQWPAGRVNATPREIAQAGFYYLGERDRVKCFYCGGGLENWEPNDDPWTEHAKWFPNCEFLLRHKGPDFVHGVSGRFPNLRRPVDQNPPTPPPMETNFNIPGIQGLENLFSNFENFGGATNAVISGNTITVRPGETFIQNNPNPAYESITVNPSGIQIQVRRTGTGPSVTRIRRRTPGSRLRVVQGRGNQQPQFVDPRQNAGRHEETVNQAMETSPLVTSAREMGFTDDVIRVVLLSKCEESGQIFDSFEPLLEALIQYRDEMERMGINPPEQPAAGNEPPRPGAANPGEEASLPAEQRLRNLEETRLCKLCHRERATVVLMPCAHLAICVGCSQRTVRICPVCKRMVTENIRSFIS